MLLQEVIDICAENRVKALNKTYGEVQRYWTQVYLLRLK